VSKLANSEGHWFGETQGWKELQNAAQEPKEMANANHQSEEVDRLARVLKAGTVFLSPDKVRQIIQATRESAKDSLEKINTNIEDDRRLAECAAYLDQGANCRPPVAPSLALEYSLSQASCGNRATDQPESNIRGLAICPSSYLPEVADKVGRENLAVGLCGIALQQARQYACQEDVRHLDPCN
jgi:hypothetical protein